MHSLFGFASQDVTQLPNFPDEGRKLHGMCCVHIHKLQKHLSDYLDCVIWNQAIKIIWRGLCAYSMIGHWRTLTNVGETSLSKRHVLSIAAHLQVILWSFDFNVESQEYMKIVF